MVIEDDAIIEYVSHHQVEAAVKLVRAKGYRCDSVSSLMPTLRGGFTLKCNNWRYVYSIADRGGRYVVTVGWVMSLKQQILDMAQAVKSNVNQRMDYQLIERLENIADTLESIAEDVGDLERLTSTSA